MKLISALLAGLSSAESEHLGIGILELETANWTGYSGFTGTLSVYIGRNCVINPQKGKICDYKHEVDINGMSAPAIKVVRLFDFIDPHEDQLILSYRSKSEAIFSSMNLQIQPNNGGPQQVINLMNLAGGGQDYTVFDFDGVRKPCDSNYPSGGIGGPRSSCRFDTIYDLYSSVEKTQHSLFAGHVINNNLMTSTNRDPSSGASQIHFKTGSNRSDGTRADLMVYYGTNCGEKVCEYTKELAALLKDYNKSYNYYLPEFDFNNDQLIFDFRDSDGVSLAELVFIACWQGECKEFNLYEFDSAHSEKLAFDFNSPSYPCGDNYQSYECVFDAVYDFKTKKVHFDKSVIIGQI